jgi:hypothetical protein
MTEQKGQSDPNEPPEDVASLYSWANLHGAKYRDFSASRAQTREKARQRVEQAMEEEHQRSQQSLEPKRGNGDTRKEETAPQRGAQQPYSQPPRPLQPGAPAHLTGRVLTVRVSTGRTRAPPSRRSCFRSPWFSGAAFVPAAKPRAERSHARRKLHAAPQTVVRTRSSRKCGPPRVAHARSNRSLARRYAAGFARTPCHALVCPARRL